MDKQKLLDIVDQYKDEMIRDVCDFIRIPSISSDLDQVGKALDYTLNLGKRKGFNSESVLDGQVGIIEIGEGKETLGILSHVDVVPPGDLNEWETHPFEPVIKNGNIYGRGSLDDKGAIIACIYAMKSVMDMGIPLKKRIQFILGTQEEVDWTDMRAYTEKYELPDYGFTPDGEFPLCNIEKGTMDVEVVIPLHEESKVEGLYLIKIEGGTASNVVPGKCYAQLLKRTKRSDGTYDEEVIELKEEGVAAHSCQPEKGENAIIKLCHKLCNMELAENAMAKAIHIIEERFSDMDCRGIGLSSENEYLNGEYIHHNTLSLNQIFTKRGSLRFVINIRFAYGANDEEFVKVIDNIVSYIGGKVESYKSLPAVYIKKDSPFLKVFAKAYENVSGLKNEFTLAYGGSYAKAMKNIISWGPIFPGEEDSCHEPNEYMSIDSLMLNAKIFALAIADIVLSDDSFI